MKDIFKLSQRKNTKLKSSQFYNSLYYSFLILISIIKMSSNAPFIQSNSYEVLIKVNGTGLQKILGRDNFPCPNLVTINDQAINIDPDNYTFINIPDTLEDYPIKIVWNSGITNLYSMFLNLTNLLEVDFSKFDTSSVISMDYMFMGCLALTSIKLESLNTPSLTKMRMMFYDCASLTVLDLSSFNTELVTDMQNLFRGCNILESINMANFDTSNLELMGGMFYDNYNLKSLNLLNFNT